MVTPLRRRLKVIAICATAAFLLLFSVCITLSGFLAWHVLTTRPYHELPLFFSYSNNTSQSLTAYTPLSSRGLRSVQQLSASIQLHLPESDANFDNSVFQVQADLFGSSDAEGKEGVCLTRASSQAVLRYRSRVHRAIRALSLSIPLLLGVTSEYQRIQVYLLEYRAVPGEDGWLPQLDGIRVDISPAQVQVAQAKVRLRVVRRSFVSGMWNERRASTFVVVMLMLWYSLVAGMFVLLWMVSWVQSALWRVWEGASEVIEEDCVSVNVIGGNVYEKGVVSAALPPRFGEVGRREGRREFEVGSACTMDEGLRRRVNRSRGKPP